MNEGGLEPPRPYEYWHLKPGLSFLEIFFMGGKRPYLSKENFFANRLKSNIKTKLQILQTNALIVCWLVEYTHLGLLNFPIDDINLFIH